MITAKKIYQDMLDMPVSEREKLFAFIAKKGFERDGYSHSEVFDDLKHAPFTIKEAAEYLEVAEITVRRWASQGVLKSRRLGKNIVFNIDELRNYKKQRQLIKN